MLDVVQGVPFGLYMEGTVLASLFKQLLPRV
jgi:hypothetical protein